MRFRYVSVDQTNPYLNLAMEQELMSHVEEDMAILFLWQNDNTIVIGRNQDAACECRVDEFLKAGGQIARRRSGGGAVYHDLGNLNYSILSRESETEACRYQEIVKNALSEFNIDAEFNGRNDLTVTGRKFSGNATYTEGEMICQHGTILISSGIEKMTYYLTPEKSKLERNHVASVASRVVNLSTLNEGITVETMKQALIRVLHADELEYHTDADRMKELKSFYESKAWIYGGER